MERLEHNTTLAMEWFENNYIKLNEDKCHLVVGHQYETFEIKLWKPGFWKTRMESYLG